MKIGICSQICPVDGVQPACHIAVTSLLFVSTTGRGAASSEVAPAFFLGGQAGSGIGRMKTILEDHPLRGWFQSVFPNNLNDATGVLRENAGQMSDAVLLSIER